MAFWDASAIIPLCCSQPATAQGRRLQREFTRMVVWWGTPIEARSAFARLVREERLRAVERVKAIRLLGSFAPPGTKSCQAKRCGRSRIDYRGHALSHAGIIG